MFENVNSIVNEILLQKNKDAGYSALPVIFNQIPVSTVRIYKSNNYIFPETSLANGSIFIGCVIDYMDWANITMVTIK